MSPARGKSGSPKRGKAKRRRRGLPIVLALLGLVAAAACGLALYLGFVPGPESLLGRRAAAALPDDSTLAASVTPTPGASDAPALDTAATPAAAPADSAPAAVTAVDSAAGDFVYHGTGRCLGCHGATGEGAPGLGPSLRAAPGRLGDGSVASIARVVAGGAPPSEGYRIAMPSYAGQLSADDVARVAAYVFTLAHSGATADTAAAPLPADPAAGAVNADAAPAHPTVPPPTVPPPTVPRPTVPRPTVPPPPAARRP
jgi:mono/diheme cytochrome c family protein